MVLGYIVLLFLYSWVIYLLSATNMDVAKACAFLIQLLTLTVPLNELELAFFEIFNFSPLDATGKDCFAPLNPLGKHAIAISMPVFLLVAVGIQFLVHLLYETHRGTSASPRRMLTIKY